MTKVFALILLLSACDGSPRGDSEQLTVFAASSLTDAFGALARAFAEEEPDAAVTPSFAGSQVLRIQIEEGAPADVFASADASHVRALEARGLIEDSRVFARSELVVIVPAGASEIGAFEDLVRAERLVIGDAAVPAGRYTRTLLDRASARFGDDFVAQVWSRVASEESSVRLVRAKVELGEADAAIVYRSDAVSSGRVRAIEIPDELGPTVEYHAGVVARSDAAPLAHRWLEHLQSERARRILSAHGFEPMP